jgi:hypothetical protein
MAAPAAPPHEVADAESATPRVRVRRAPQFEPPFDDERTPTASIPGSAMLPFAWPARGPRPQRPVTPRQARGPGGGPPTVTVAGNGGQGSAAGHGGQGSAGHGAQGSAAGHGAQGSAAGHGAETGGTPSGRDAQRTNPSRPRGGAGGRGSGPAPAAAAAERFLNVCLEVLNGHRPASHLRAVTTAAQVAEVTDQLVRRTTRTYLATTGRTEAVPRRVRLLRLHTCEPRDGIAEVVAVLAYGSSTWAMAARLERHADTWLCTLVHVI